VTDSAPTQAPASAGLVVCGGECAQALNYRSEITYEKLTKGTHDLNLQRSRVERYDAVRPKIEAAQVENRQALHLEVALACQIAVSREGPLRVAVSTGRRNTVHPYRQGVEAYGVPVTWLGDDPRLYKHE